MMSSDSSSREESDTSDTEEKSIDEIFPSSDDEESSDQPNLVEIIPDLEKEITRSFHNSKLIQELEREGKVELELRLRGISKRRFQNTNFLGGIFSEYEIEIYKIKGKENVSLRKYENKWEIKETVWKKRFNKDLSLVLSVERPRNPDSKGYALSAKRNIQRWRTQKGIFIFDRSIVRDDEEKEHFEIEIEFSQFDMSNQTKSFDQIKSFLANTSLKNSILREIPRKIHEFIPQIRLWGRGRFPRPINLSLRKVLREFSKGGSVSLKVDGRRVFIVLGPHGTFIISPLMEMVLGSFVMSKNYSIADAEIAEGKVYIFDIMIRSNKSLVDMPLSHRISLILPFCKEINKGSENKIFLPKKHFIFSNYLTFEEACKNAVGGMNKSIALYQEGKSPSIDGLIFTSSGKYTSPVLKWKRINTVDFLYKEKELMIKDKNGKLVSSGFTPDFIAKEKEIVECSLNIPRKIASFIRSREDRKHPNSLKVLNHAIKSIKENPKTSALIEKGKGVVLMRAYHNNIKRKILMSLNGVLIDIGTGRGGDLSKWKKFKEIICIEPDLKQIDIIKKRMNEINCTQHIKLISSRADILKDRTIFTQSTYDNISCFFCVNLMDQKEEDDLIQNSFDVLKEGGSLIIIAMTKEKGPMKDEINTRYEISMISEKEYTINIPGTFVEKQRERLVDKSQLIQKSKKIGMIYHERDNPFSLGKKNIFMSDEEKLFSSFFEIITLTKESSDL